jgi:hypothetical protein
MDLSEAVLLLGRALACIQAITAALDASYLPQRLIELHHYRLQLQSEYLTSYEQVQISFYFGRIAFLLAMSLVFWNGGPRIARFPLPQRKSPATSVPEIHQ